MGRAVVSVSFDQDTLTIINQAEEILKKEGKKFNLSKSVQDLVKQGLIKLVRDHGDGNPGSTMDQFFNEGFIITPALARAEKPADIENYFKAIAGTKQFEQVGEFLTIWVQKYNAVQEAQSL